MEKAAVYSLLTAKRYFRLIPFTLVITVILVSVLGAVLANVLGKRANSEENQPVSIAIAGDVNDVYLKTALDAVKNYDMTRYAMSFPIMTEEEAKEQFKNSRITGYIVIPEGYMKAARAGNVESIYFVTTSGAQSLSSRYVSEMIRTISEMVVASQKATYGYERFALDRGVTFEELKPSAQAEVAKYIMALVNRDLLFSVNKTGFSGASTGDDSVVAGILTVFLFLWGITCCTVATRKDVRLCRSLGAEGVGAGRQILAEYAAYLFFFFASVAAIAALAVAAFGIFHLSLPGGIAVTGEDALRFALSLPFPILIASSVQFFIYEATSGITGGVLAQFLTAILLGLATGCLYPPHFFPKTVQKIGEFLPTGIVRRFISEFSSGKAPSATVIVSGIVCFALFTALSVLFRKAKITGVREG
ncbi:MAG: ABC transporter permease [Clostridia bacterium]|nr:ABC transporter permease [Clostridia bacterium]